MGVKRATTKRVRETHTYEKPIENQRVPLNGSKNAKRVGGTFSGALYNIEIPKIKEKLGDFCYLSNITKLHKRHSEIYCIISNSCHSEIRNGSISFRWL